MHVFEKANEMIVEHWQDIPAPAHLVWSVTSNVEMWPEWMPTIQKVEPLTPGGIALKSRYLIKQPLQKAATWEVTRFEPPHIFEWERRDEGELRFVGTHEVKAGNGTTRARVALQAFGAASTFLRPVYSLTIIAECRAMRRYCTQLAQKGERPSRERS